MRALYAMCGNICMLVRKRKHSASQLFFGAKMFDIRKVRYWARIAKRGPVNRFRIRRPGQTKMQLSADLGEQIKAKILDNWRITRRQLAEEMGVHFATANRIVKKLGFWRICAKWVPKLLTREQKNEWKKIAQELLDWYFREGERLMLNIVTGDKLWIRHYGPELKAQSSECCHSCSAH